MIKFLKEYIKNPRQIGAIAPSTRYLAEGMINGIDFENVNCIIEYGPGTGVFTEQLIQRCNERTKILLVEYNEKFCDELKARYGSRNNVIIINDSAENVSNYLLKHQIKKVDYIISGLPFTSLPKDISENILDNTSSILSKNGEFRTFQYSMVKKHLFERKFENISHTRVYRNLPPAYVLKCSNK